MKLVIFALVAFAAFVSALPHPEASPESEAEPSANVQCAGVEDASSAYCVFKESRSGTFYVRCAPDVDAYNDLTGNLQHNGEDIDWRQFAFGRDFVSALLNERDASLADKIPKLGVHARCTFESGRVECAGGVWQIGTARGFPPLPIYSEQKQMCLPFQCGGSSLYDFTPVLTGTDYECRKQFTKDGSIV